MKTYKDTEKEIQEGDSLKVGDRVLFTIDRKVFVDVITYIDNETIEGEKYDLTIQKLTKI